MGNQSSSDTQPFIPQETDERHEADDNDRNPQNKSEAPNTKRDEDPEAAEAAQILLQMRYSNKTHRQTFPSHNEKHPFQPLVTEQEIEAALFQRQHISPEASSASFAQRVAIMNRLRAQDPEISESEVHSRAHQIYSAEQEEESTPKTWQVKELCQNYQSKTPFDETLDPHILVFSIAEAKEVLAAPHRGENEFTYAQYEHLFKHGHTTWGKDAKEPIMDQMQRHMLVTRMRMRQDEVMTLIALEAIQKKKRGEGCGRPASRRNAVNNKDGAAHMSYAGDPQAAVAPFEQHALNPREIDEIKEQYILLQQQKWEAQLKRWNSASKTGPPSPQPSTKEKHKFSILKPKRQIKPKKRPATPLSKLPERVSPPKNESSGLNPSMSFQETIKMQKQMKKNQPLTPLKKIAEIPTTSENGFPALNSSVSFEETIRMLSSGKKRNDERDITFVSPASTQMSDKAIEEASKSQRTGLAKQRSGRIVGRGRAGNVSEIR